MPYPGNIVAPSVDGEPVVGALLTYTPGEWNANAVTVELEWVAGLDTHTVQVGGDTYTVTAADLGETVRARETATGSAAEVVIKLSNGIGPIVDAVVEPPPTSPIVVPPEELEQLFGLEPAEAARVSALVQIAIESYVWPAAIPDPVPPPVHAVGLALAARFSGAALTKAGAVVGETIGSYSYRLASPLTFDNVVLVLGDLAEQLNPWAPMHTKVYDLDVSPWGGAPWPVDWWQRDLDNLYASSPA